MLYTTFFIRYPRSGPPLSGPGESLFDVQRVTGFRASSAGLMCNDKAMRDEAHPELSQQHRQDVGLLLAIQPFAALDKAIHRFRSKCLRKEIFHIPEERVAGSAR